MTPTCVAYTRCSGNAQVDGDTWDRQNDSIRNCAASKGLTLIHEYREEAIPGKLGEESRPAFQDMITSLLGNGCRIIIIESMDRLARAYVIQEQLITYIASKGLTLIAASTGEDITAAMMGDPMKRAIVQIQGVIAEWEKNMIVAKLAKARKRKRENGGKSEGRKPYGFRPGEREVIDQIMAYANHGVQRYSPSEIAWDLNTYNIPTRAGRKWTGVQVKRIIEREKGETK